MQCFISRFVLLFFCVSALEADFQSAKNLAVTMKSLLHAIGRPAQVTAMVCWSPEFSFRFYKSFTTTSDFNLKNNFMLGLTSVHYTNLPIALEEHQQVILLDISCNNSREVLNNSNELLVNCVWILFNHYSLETLNENISHIFKRLPILPKSEIFYIFKHISANNNVRIDQIYRTGIDSPLVFEQFGIIANHRFIDYRRIQVTSKRRQNLLGLNLKASMVITNNDTLEHLSDYRNIETDPITKVNVVLTGYLMSYLNATVHYSVVNSWGYINDTTGEWSGMVGELIRNEAELGASPLFMTIERVPIIQYIAMPTPTGSRFVFRSPKLSYTDNVFLLPFDNFVWYCLGALVLVTALCLTCAVFLEWKYSLVDTIEDHEVVIANNSILRPKVGDIFLVIYGATCQQGTAVTPRSITARIILVVAYIILMFLYTSYAANIVALLQSPSTKIKTLKDLYESRLDIGVDDTVFNRYFFAHATEPIREKIYQQKVIKKNGKDNFMSLEDGVERVRKGLFAFHMELALGYKLMSETFYEDEKCGIKEIAYLQVTEPWYAIRKNSSYKEMFKIGMIRMHEHGLQERENSKMYTKKPKCTGSGGNFITASLVDTKPAILVLLWGFAFTIALLVIELLTHHLHSLKSKCTNDG